MDFLKIFLPSLFLLAAQNLNAQSGGPDESVLKTATAITGGIIAGEAAALFVGMNLLSGPDNSWVSFKNNSLLGLDLIVGSGLIYLAFSEPKLYQSGWFYALAAVSLVTHGYREFEYLGNFPNAFCANTPLFVLNNVKSAALLFVTFNGIYFQFLF